MKQLCVLLFFGFFISCGKPECKNTNPILAANLPESEPYKAELARLIELTGADNLDYYVDSYAEIGGRRQLTAAVHGDSICAKAVILITDSIKGIEGIVAAKGGGYRYAELYNLKFDIVRKDGNTSFIYKGVGRIID